MKMDVSDFKIPEGINPDLAEERLNKSFPQEELTNYLDGSPEKTKERRSLEKFIIEHPLLKEEKTVVVETLAASQRYKYEKEMACRLMLVARQAEEEGLSDAIRGMFSSGLGAAVLPDGSPINLHFVMFVPTLVGQGEPDQIAEILGKAWNLDIVGTYAQTELGHGTFIRGLELQAEYDPERKEFELNSPTLTSFKWWPGGLGRTATHAVVMAKLITQGVNRGVHPFLVQLRSEETNQPLKGVIVGEIGPKLGMNANDNGYLGFQNYRIPLRALLSKNARVEPDGSYVSPPREKLGYATMVFVRTAVAMNVTVDLQKALTIAVRYSAVRRQGESAPGGKEPKILDYPTQQAKLLPSLAMAVGFKIASSHLWDTYNNIQNEIEQGNYDNLPELHALSCAMKALLTSECAHAIDEARKSCGGHGFMCSSGLPRIFGMATAACTYEGENTVLQLQIARFLIKSARSAREGNPQAPSVSYLNNTFGHKPTVDIISDFGLVELFEKAAAGKVYSLLDQAQDNPIMSTEAADMHARSFVISEFAQGVTGAPVSTRIKRVLSDLFRLLATTWILQFSSDFLRYSGLNFAQLDRIREDRDTLLNHLRPIAVPLVDSFDFRDEVLQSSLGSYDGWVYHRLFQAANELNKETYSKEDTVKYIMDKLRSKL